jgi:DNA invertase Pin-like site-specific DNA recombinase
MVRMGCFRIIALSVSSPPYGGRENWPAAGVAKFLLAEWDRATRSLMDGIHIMGRVHKRGTFIKVLDRPGLDLTTPSGRGILALLSGLAEEERHRILKRANEGRTAVIKRGTKLGRKPKLDDHQQKEALKRLKVGESCRAIAKTFRVHTPPSRGCQAKSRPCRHAN